MPRRWMSVLPMLGLLALLLLTFHELAFSGRILGRGDTFLYFYPYWGVRDALLRAGMMPLWSPDIFLGVPLLANPQLGTFYPPNWLTILLAPPDAIRISILLHLAWGMFGAYWLARHVLKLGAVASVVAAAVFALGGAVGAHVEQVNQLQGLSWMPILFGLLHRMAEHPRRRTLLLLAAGMALQLFSGHSQTAFITGVGMGVYLIAAWKPRALLFLALASVGALILAAPQWIPTLELIGQGARSGGLDPWRALSFSLHPALIGRALLPNYDARLFTEYVAYTGVGGVMLMAVGLFSRQGKGGFAVRRAWLAVLVIGLFLAIGRYNLLNWTIIQWPGFSLFRVPARWLALYGLGSAILAGLGADALLAGRTRRRGLLFGAALTGLLIGLALIVGRVPVGDFVGNPRPPLWVFAVWLSAGAIVAAAFWMPQRWRGVAFGVVALELIFAAQQMPYSDLIPRTAWTAPRFTQQQLAVYNASDPNGLNAAGVPPGRLLSVSGLLFDSGDKATLEARAAQLRLSPMELGYMLVAEKLKETVSPNFPLVWGIPSVDGFDGGLLPTERYNELLRLMEPENADIPGDGRLREFLALPQCWGACIPAERWLQLMDVDTLLTDKVFDVWHEGVAYDTTLPATDWRAPYPFEADEVRALFACTSNDCPVPTLDSRPAASVTYSVTETLALAAFPLEALTDAQDWSTAGTEVRAVTLLDRRDGNFLQISPSGWERVLSSDIELYRQPTDRASRAEFYTQVQFVASVEAAQAALIAPDFDATTTLVIENAQADVFSLNGEPATAQISFEEYQPTAMTLTVESETSGYLLLKDSYYPGWQARVNGELVKIWPANVNFRTIQLPAGTNRVRVEYRPVWWPPILWGGLLVWGVALFLISLRRRDVSDD